MSRKVTSNNGVTDEDYEDDFDDFEPYETSNEDDRTERNGKSNRSGARQHEGVTVPPVVLEVTNN